MSVARARFDFFIRPVDWLSGLANTLAALCLFGIFLLVGAEIVMRNVFLASLDFSWDVSAYLMGAAFMLSAASALKNGSHVRVTALREVLPARAALGLDAAACLVGLVIAVMLTWALGQSAWLSFLRGSTSSSVVRIPLVWPQSVLALGAGLLSLQMLAQLLRVTRGEDLPTGEGIE
ncbi:TRAP transporter small permease subunit [Pseudooceanicola sp. GBMRC 2024]|uniref:TRAP transporter small permease protein n=1 Tax=Pseudooceanicola albus TaxID=2692189 RepID=A0A6L7G1Z2_9RHOB|nr:TRAP transporter small permease [Pseudooceanicola albus]MXN17752.1 TRAP transporter small permease subunit [Pseudooceanicola albus]